jgi:hypothetical protein
MLVIREGANISMMRGVIPSYPQSAVTVLPVIRIEIAIKRTILLNLKHAIINDNGLHLEIIKAFNALEIQDLKTLDKLILKRF